MSTYKKLGTIPLADLMPLLEKKAPDLFEEIKSRVNWDGTTWSGSTRVHIPNHSRSASTTG